MTRIRWKWTGQGQVPNPNKGRWAQLTLTVHPESRSLPSHTNGDLRGALKDSVCSSTRHSPAECQQAHIIRDTTLVLFCSLSTCATSPGYLSFSCSLCGLTWIWGRFPTPVITETPGAKPPPSVSLPNVAVGRDAVKRCAQRKPSIRDSSVPRYV